MLETLPQVSITQDVHRFANLTHLAVFAAKKGLTIDEVTDVIAFATDDVVAELMKGPFQRKPLLGNKFGLVSRFSDGEWPVFYAAIGRTTAEKESTHHYGRKAAGDATARRGVHYSIVRCRFSGQIIDLQPKLAEWPNLISDDYAFCNGLGKEAHHGAVGGFLAPSARNAGGNTVPAFIEGTLSDPLIEAAAKLTFDGGDTVVEVKEIP
jgi:hypothetical protein